MANMGMSDLVVVAPRCDTQDETAIAYAAHARSVLDGARVVEDIPTALSGCVRTYVTSSRLGMYRRQAAIPPRKAAGEIIQQAAHGPVAIAFGREDYGIKTSELLHFDRLITIPADESYPVLNLAAATTVVCYELWQASAEAKGEAPLPMAMDSGMATDDRRQILFDKLFDALDRVGFFFGQNPDHLKYSFRHMLGRLDLTINEVDILIGMACQIRWYVDHHPQRIDPKD